MKCLIAALLLAWPVVATAQAAPLDGNAAMMRKIWAEQPVESVGAVQQVYSRTVSFALPRPMLPVYSAEVGGRFIMEYVPDGETVERWTRMVTVTGAVGAGAAHLTDAELADALFNRGQCEGRVYADLGPVENPVLGYRALLIGCGVEGQAATERAAIAMFRDSETVWTVQFAQHGDGTSGFATRAQDELAKLAPGVTCAPGETMPECKPQ
ncbi:MAG TPA: hypothetical protein PK808_00260 [Polymorphobacter sp.]|nr:hypothetical protein [Polymorphobacter sp.]